MKRPELRSILLVSGALSALIAAPWLMVLRLVAGIRKERFALLASASRFYTWTVLLPGLGVFATFLGSVAVALRRGLGRSA